MFRELWRIHWRKGHGREWVKGDGALLVHGGIISMLRKALPDDQELVGCPLVFGTRSNGVRVGQGVDPTTLLQVGTTLRVGGSDSEDGELFNVVGFKEPPVQPVQASPTVMFTLSDEDGSNSVEVTLTNDGKTAIGINLKKNPSKEKDAAKVAIGSVDQGSQAEQTGKVVVDQVITHVNGDDVKKLNVKQIKTLIKPPKKLKPRAGQPWIVHLDRTWTGPPGLRPVFETEPPPTLEPAASKTEGHAINGNYLKKYEAGDLEAMDASPLYTLLAGLKSSPYALVSSGGMLSVRILKQLYASNGLTLARMLTQLTMIRNVVDHGGTVMSIATYNEIRTSMMLSLEFAFGDANDDLRAHFEQELAKWDVDGIELLPKTESQRIGKAKKRTTMLTEKQASNFAEFGEGNEHVANAGGNARWLVEAPSGSGKTVLCIKLAARFVRERLRAMQLNQQMAEAAGATTERSAVAAGAPQITAPDRMLVLVHSKVLCAETAAKIQEELLQSNGGGGGGGAIPTTALSEPTATSHPGIPPMESFVTIVPSPTASTPSFGPSVVEVLVITADAFVDAARSKSVGTFCSAVVDEGHVCFGFQPQPSLDGQHQCNDPAMVRELFEDVLAPSATTPNYSVPVIIFHDQSYQYVHGGKANMKPVYPSGCKQKMAPLEIVRNTGPIRDVSVPFSRVLYKSDQLTKDLGRQSYHPLLNENGSGREVKMVDVERATVRGTCETGFNLVRKLTGQEASKKDGEINEQCNKYAQAILSELMRIQSRLDFSSGGGGGGGAGSADWARHVAVLVPGSPSKVAEQLVAAVRKAAAADSADPRNIQAVLDALPVQKPSGGVGDGACTQYGQTGLYFGPVENFAGLERSFVIATGMQHPDYLIYKKQVEGWQKNEFVDPRMYLAVTRCTLELSIVEVQVRKYAAHFKISNVASTKGSSKSDRLATFAGESVYSDQPQHAWVEAASTDAQGLRFVRVGVTVDLADPPQEEDLESAVVLTLKQLDQRMWNETPFKWDHCKKGIRELNMDGSIVSSQDSGKDDSEGGGCVALDGEGKCQLLRDMLNPKKLSRLSKLQLRKNELVLIPKELGNLAALTVLNLNNNQLTAIPNELGKLAALTQLRLSNNQLSAIPKELGDLAALTLLHLQNNQLTAVPKELGDLAALTQLDLNHNKLTAIPKELGNLVALNHNQLISQHSQQQQQHQHVTHYRRGGGRGGGYGGDLGGGYGRWGGGGGHSGGRGGGRSGGRSGGRGGGPQPICRNFQQNGNCRFGAGCHFKHAAGGGGSKHSVGRGSARGSARGGGRRGSGGGGRRGGRGQSI